MADYDSSLPIRSEADGTDERVQVKIVDATSPDSQQAVVDSDSNLHVEVHGNNPAAGDETLRLSELGHPNSDGVYDGTNNTDPANVGLVATDRATTPADADQTQRLTAKTGTTDTDVHALDISLHDEDGNAYTTSNPLPVTSVDSEGTEINDYDTASAVAAGGTSNHDYPASGGTTLKLTQIWASASAKLKIEVQVETGVGTGTYTTRFVGFNSTANPNIDITLKEPISVAAGVNVRIIRTNNDNQAQDVYSTISGHEIS